MAATPWMAMTLDWSPDAVVADVIQALARAADPERAPVMAAYMQNRFPFLGVPAGPRRTAVRPALAAVYPPNEGELVATVERLWGLAEREYRYVGADLLQAHVTRCGPALIGALEGWITSRPWWDTTDPLATRVVGPLVAANPSLATTMDTWVAGDDLWLARAAILHQLHLGAATDTGRLFRYCRDRSGDTDFFIRKAIGWALRHHARTDPGSVAAFVGEYRDQLSPLSLREATRHL